MPTCGATQTFNELPLASLADLTGGEDYAAARFEDQAWEAAVLKQTSLDECLFTRCDLAATPLEGVELHECRLDGCNLANARWVKTRLSKTDLHKCRATGLQLIDANLNEVRFTGCKLNLTAVLGTKIRNGVFDRCDLREADFQQVVLTGVTFRNCDLRGARFAGCQQTGLDLRGSHLAGALLEPQLLRKATVDASQLVDLAPLFELKVRPTD